MNLKPSDYTARPCLKEKEHLVFMSSVVLCMMHARTQAYQGNLKTKGKSQLRRTLSWKNLPEGRGSFSVVARS